MFFNKKLTIIIFSAIAFSAQAMETPRTIETLPLEIIDEIFLNSAQVELENSIALKTRKRMPFLETDLASAKEKNLYDEFVKVSMEGALWDWYKRLLTLRQVNKLWYTHYVRGTAHIKRIKHIMMPHIAKVMSCPDTVAPYVVNALAPLIVRPIPLIDVEQKFMGILKGFIYLFKPLHTELNSFISDIATKKCYELLPLLFTCVDWPTANHALITLHTLRTANKQCFDTIIDALKKTASKESLDFLKKMKFIESDEKDLFTVIMHFFHTLSVGNVPKLDLINQLLGNKELTPLEKQLLHAFITCNSARCNELLAHYADEADVHRTALVKNFLCWVCLIDEETEMIRVIMNHMTPHEFLPSIVLIALQQVKENISPLLTVITYAQTHLDEQGWGTFLKSVLSHAIRVEKIEIVRAVLEIAFPQDLAQMYMNTINHCRLNDETLLYEFLASFNMNENDIHFFFMCASVLSNPRICISKFKEYLAQRNVSWQFIENDKRLQQFAYNRIAAENATEASEAHVIVASF